MLEVDDTSIKQMGKKVRISLAKRDINLDELIID